MDIQKSIVGILDANRKIIGTGFLATDTIVLTCAHVIKAAKSEPGDQVIIRFAVDSSEIFASVDSLSWSPVEEHDTALLHIERKPNEAEPLPLGLSSGTSGHTFRTYGYATIGGVQGLGARGEIIDIVDGGNQLQITSQEIDRGFSGAPVIDEARGVVVGMITWGKISTTTQRNRDTTFAITSESIQRVCPKLFEIYSQENVNPFYAGGAVPPKLFVGRDTTLALIKNRLGGTTLQSVSIVGERRMGKSSVLCYVRDNAAELFQETNPIVIYLDLMKGYCHTFSGFMKAIRLELSIILGKELWQPSDDNDLQTLSFSLEELSANGTRLILCLDEMDNLTKRKAEFDSLIEELRAAGQMGQVGLLTASKKSLADLCNKHGLSSPFYNIFVQDILGLLDKSAWRSLVTRHLTLDEEELQIIEHLSGGHPFYTQLVASCLWGAKHFNSSNEIDWRNQALEDLTFHWGGWWQHFSQSEKNTLEFLAGVSKTHPREFVINKLTRRGIIRDRRPFSAAFEEWIRSNHVSNQ